MVKHHTIFEVIVAIHHLRSWKSQRHISNQLIAPLHPYTTRISILITIIAIFNKNQFDNNIKRYYLISNNLTNVIRFSIKITI